MNGVSDFLTAALPWIALGVSVAVILAFFGSKKEKQKTERIGDKKMAKNNRFEEIYSQGTVERMEIWVDKETGVNYVFHSSGYAGGMTVLLDKDGKPVITPVENR